MQTRLTLQPHQRGAKHLLAQYGDRLLCVRYRYDPEQQKRLKTVELIVEEREWTPKKDRRPYGRVVDIRVAAAELEIRRQVKSAGGKWQPQRGVWELLYEHVLALQLEGRIVHGQAGI